MKADTAAQSPKQDPHRSLHSESGALPGEHSGRSKNPLVKVAGLVLAGDDDPIVPLINGRILARCIPHARLHVINGGGHMFLLEQPAEIAQMIAAFLRSEPPRSRPA